MNPSLIGVVSAVPVAATAEPDAFAREPVAAPVLAIAVVEVLSTVAAPAVDVSPDPAATSDDARPLVDAAGRGLSTSIGTIRPASSIPTTTPVSV